MPSYEGEGMCVFLLQSIYKLKLENEDWYSMLMVDMTPGFMLFASTEDDFQDSTQ